MRKFMWSAALVLGLAWVEAAPAQQINGPIFNFPKTINIMPNFTNNSPMSYVNPNAPIAGSIVRPNSTGTSFPYKLGSMFYSSGRSNFISSTTTVGRSTFPTPAQMQATAPSYFQAFQMYRAQPIQP